MITSMEKLNQTITIKREVVPDLVIQDLRKDWNDKEQYFTMSFLFKEQLMLTRECDDEGKPKYSYGTEGTYGACKLEEDKVMIMDGKHGWRVHELATAEWANIIAERELLK